MTQESFTLTMFGLKQLLLNGCKNTYIGLDGSSVLEDRTAASPSQELTTNGAGRQLAEVIDISTATTIGYKLAGKYEFSGILAINAIFIASSPSSGNNMMGRGKLAATKNVGPEDTASVDLDLIISQVTS